MASNTDPEIQSIVDKGLRNDLILDSIFQGLRIRDLKMCRLVNLKWNQLALKEIQRKKWNARNILFENSYNEKSDFEEYLNFFRPIPMNIPYLCHKFTMPFDQYHNDPLPDTPPPPREDREIVIDFCKTFKKQIKGIDVSGEVSLCLQDTLEILGESLEELGIKFLDYQNVYPPGLFITNEFTEEKLVLPKLKSISVDAALHGNSSIGTEQNREEENSILSVCNSVFKNILSKLRPNTLEELNFHNWGKFDKAVEHLIEFNQVNSLKKLALYPNINLKKGNLLIFKRNGMNMQLKQLRIHNVNTKNDGVARYGTFDIDPEELHQFLHTQKKSLQHINLICSTYSFPLEMMEVKTLTLRLLGRGNAINTLNINFYESFPKLNTLDLWNVWFRPNRAHEMNPDAQIISEQEPCNYLEKLILSCQMTLGIRPMNRILRIYPRLSSLEMKAIEPEIYQMIWNSADFADSLNVLILWIPSRGHKHGPAGHMMRNCLQLDTIFSGVSYDEIVSVTSDRWTQKFNLDESQPNSILKLKNLRKLHLHWIHRSENQLRPFTDFIGLCVFERMKKLNELFIEKYIHKFSQTCIARLQASTQNFLSEVEKDREPFHNGRYALYLPTKMSKYRMHVSTVY